MLGSVLGLFTGGGSNIMLYVLGGLAIAAIVGGFWLYQRNIVSSLEDTIAEKDRKIEQLEVEITGLRIDNDRLKLSNESLANEMRRRADENARIREEVENLAKERDQSLARLADFEAKIRDAERNERIEAIREGRRAQLLLNLTNKNIDCFIENFNNPNGECVAGEWKER